ncbi:MAG: uroporphyrinogen decarboxylase family protein [Victivallaceae bacterium]
MSNKIRESHVRIRNAFMHLENDRTPLFELFWDFHPIYWDVCGRNPATDESVYWDALSEGISLTELVEYQAQAKYKMAKFFGLDIINVGFNVETIPFRPKKTGKGKWLLDKEEYYFDDRTKRIRKLNYTAKDAFSCGKSEEDEREFIKRNFNCEIKKIAPERLLVLKRLKELAEKDGRDLVYMGEIGAGTGVAQYPEFMLMWMIAEPDLLQKWIQIKARQAFYETTELISAGCEIIALGGDVSCDKGPLISPGHYREFVLPVIREHVDIVHKMGAFAVYTSDGNHWKIKDDFFFNSGIDGYKEVDCAAGMTFSRLVDEGVKDRVCIIGNIDARHLLCNGSAEEVKRNVIDCLELGRKTPGGHILHTSHSVHEDVKTENYYAMNNAYREYFGLETIKKQETAEKSI